MPARLLDGIIQNRMLKLTDQGGTGLWQEISIHVLDDLVTNGHRVEDTGEIIIAVGSADVWFAQAQNWDCFHPVW